MATVCCSEDELHVVKGTSKTFKITVSMDSQALDLTGAKALFLVKTNEGDADADALLVLKTANLAGGGDDQAKITDATGGEVEIYIIPTSTSSLDAGSYWWGFRVKTSDGKEYATTLAGSFVIDLAVAADPLP